MGKMAEKKRSFPLTEGMGKMAEKVAQNASKLVCFLSFPITRPFYPIFRVWPKFIFALFSISGNGSLPGQRHHASRKKDDRVAPLQNEFAPERMFSSIRKML